MFHNHKGMSGAATDLTSYMARVKVAAAKEGLKAYGSATKVIRHSHQKGDSVGTCIQMLRLCTDSQVQS